MRESVESEADKTTMKFIAILPLSLCLVYTQSHRVQRLVQNQFESHSYFSLNVGNLRTTFVDDHFDCSFVCLQNALCVSFNVAVFPTDTGKYRCELLPSTSYNNNEKLVVDYHSCRYSIQVSDSMRHLARN